jgi:cellulose biosynthesis protein BcsQ
LQTLTFYSYKGGVGRTLMLANMARYLASFGQRVFAVDFDLEAPGLHYKLGAESPERGLVDYLHQLFLVGEIPESLAPYVVTIEPKNAAGGSIHLLPAGAAPSPAYWRQLAKLDWHELFYSEEAPGVPLFLELKERIEQEHAPDFLLIDSRTGITEVVGATTTLLADRVVCLLLNNRENLEGAREVLRSLRRVPRLPGQAPLEVWPVLSRIPEIGGEFEAGLVRQVRDFLCAEAEDLSSTLTFPEMFVLHADPDLQLREVLSIGGGKGPEESPLLRDYLFLFDKLVPVEALVQPTIRAIAERWDTDHLRAEKDFALLAVLAPRFDLDRLLAAELTLRRRRTVRLVEEELRAEEETAVARARSLLRALGLPDPSPELTQTAAAYLEFLVDWYRYLDFRGMGVSDRVSLRLPLLDIYVPLKASRQLPEGETWARDLRIAGRALTEEEAKATGPKLSGPLPVLDLLRDQDGVVLLGDPGSGKTTFLKYLALIFATGQNEALCLDARLPVLLPLAAYANALAASDISLEDFLPRYYMERGFSLPLGDLLAVVFDRGGIVFLLDGLDEAHDPRVRHLVVERVRELYLQHRRAGNKLVLTSRIVGYREIRLEAERLVEATLVDIEDDDIESFLGKWTVALEKVAGESSLEFLVAMREREELLAAIQYYPGVRQLAANPLLLTILALMKRQGVELPARRVELYATYVFTLLRHWNLARSLAGRSVLDLDVIETMKTLAPLALWMHQVSPGVGLVREQDLYLELEQILKDRGSKPEKEARIFLQDVREHAGLLLDRGGRQYGFIHLAFQEYLAAVALAQRMQVEVGQGAQLLAEHVGDPAWREVILLTVGYLGIIQQRDEAASEVVKYLLQVAEPPGLAAVLAGQALTDLGVGGVTMSCRKQTIEALLLTIGNERVPAQVRAEAARVLTQLKPS